MPEQLGVAEIRERLANLQTISCRLAHERVRWEHGRIVSRQVGDEQIPVRRLCGWDVRRQRLSCAHTTARYSAERALLDLRAAGAIGEEACAALLAELNEIGHHVQLLDHRKGEIEKAHALAVEASGHAGTAAADASRDHAQPLIRAMESEHHDHVERLRHWRDRVLAALDGR